MGRIALITCDVLPEPDFDERLTIGALQRRGFEVEMVAWDGVERNLADFDTAVIRSPWNYYEKPKEFLEWVDQAARQTLLLNPAEVVRSNHHKGYLIGLERSGVPIVPTALATRGESKTVAEIAAQRNWDAVVVKPAVSAGSFRTQRFESGQLTAAQAWLETILLGGDALVQQYMPSVAEGGEAAYVWIGGAVTHAVVKRPRFADGQEAVSEAAVPSDIDMELLRPFVDLVPKNCLYARIDVMRGPEGDLYLSELELIEPSLFFKQYPPALDRFADSLEARLGVVS